MLSSSMRALLWSPYASRVCTTHRHRRVLCTRAKMNDVPAAASTTKPAEFYLPLFRAAAPSLHAPSYKGQAGRIAVVGGSIEYTGSPYFAAISAMRGGAHLASVFCAAEAASAIKAYSPDLIVYRGFSKLGEQCEMLDRMHAIVVGPGLGRGEDAMAVFEKVLRYAVNRSGVLVIDADALWMLYKRADLLRLIADADGSCAIYLTPNKVELQRLLQCTALEQHEEAQMQLVQRLNGNVVLIAKGAQDVIVSRAHHTCVKVQSSLKRVGGQGDILCGLLALYAFWMLHHGESAAITSASTVQRERRRVAAAVAACTIMRRATSAAFVRWRHAFLASDALVEIGDALQEVLDNYPLQ